MPNSSLLINKKATKLLGWHFLAWLLYTIFLHIAAMLTKPDISIINTLLYLLPFCFTFYISIYVLGINKKKGVAWTIASFFIVFIFMASLGYFYVYFILPEFGIVVYTSKQFKPFIQEAVLGYVRFFSFAMLYFYIRESIRKEKNLRLLQQEKSQRELENERLKQQELKAQQEKLQYEYAFLRSQINPHFLHNTLNTFFSQAMQYSPEFADNILKLASIMRYSMEALEFDSGKVSVQKELTHLQNLIDIHNLRFGERKMIVYEIEGNINGHMVPPLSFITIVENAFKYGDLTDPNCPMTIKVGLTPGEVSFYCSNKIKKSSVQISSSNIGISNLSKRLDVAFSNRYKMNAEKKGEMYFFYLTIKA
ncbi:sensor histidine kinase [Niabella beijingensis]|uniref:sensor histidine kinase n=1 Tax=Niabella beijingensis TaxID=2872700 RepID=UPI001CC003BF|nr:sensor histidine kinase [Niabella beijingensis]MBZ4188964.1 histidine kinase [Niabella beijingensis]